jgi:hypothetical protein
MDCFGSSLVRQNCDLMWSYCLWNCLKVLHVSHVSGCGGWGGLPGTEQFQHRCACLGKREVCPGRNSFNIAALVEEGGGFPGGLWFQHRCACLGKRWFARDGTVSTSLRLFGEEVVCPGRTNFNISALVDGKGSEVLGLLRDPVKGVLQSKFKPSALRSAPSSGLLCAFAYSSLRFAAAWCAMAQKSPILQSKIRLNLFWRRGRDSNPR